MLLDSWWYYKGKDAGVTVWDARPDVFPDGLAGFFDKTKWPTVKKMILSPTFLCKIDHFTKTGSGQKWGKLNSDRFLADAAQPNVGDGQQLQHGERRPVHLH